ncbi:hypothetical protein ABIC89_000859 [Variovorax boronicumulans]|uniref:hypothetical protein n=1 Tax=Variovorax boronicumulans TaxID=436515 RepID=UPI0033938ED7
MWKPASPIVIAGRVLTDQEVWWHEFKHGLQEQCDSRVDKYWLIEISRTLFRRSPDEDPRHMALPAYAILMFDPEEIEEAEHAHRAQAMRLPHLANRRVH